MKESTHISSTKIAHMCVCTMYSQLTRGFCCGNIIIVNLRTSRQKDMTPILTFTFLSEKKDDELTPFDSSRKMAACFCSHTDREGPDCLKK